MKLGEPHLLSVNRVSKRFQNTSGDIIALDDVTFSVDAGEFYAIVGPSGCGKSTLLNIIAGLEQESSGAITVGEGLVPSRLDPLSQTGTESRPSQTIDSRSPSSRLGRVGYMPQKDLLLPWRTVLQNAALGLELTGVSGRAARERAAGLLCRFGLDGFADSYPATLSGGMRQRAAFLRTILTDKSLLLLDEPFGALDALTRRSMQEWLLDVWSEMRHNSVILITHDVEEAIFLADRVAVMSPRPGRILEEFRIDLPRPRHPDLATEPEFVELRRSVMTSLRSGLEGAIGAPQ
jgi:ABC-type nitrate/sulfonate/bicarbonate transport system ATPase subunit